MDAYEAIMSRRSMSKTSERLCDKELIGRLLEAAVRAPTHHLTQPWRFVVIAGDARHELGEALAAAARREGRDPDAERAKPLRAPVLIAVIERPRTQHSRVVEREEHYAVGAAIQNILIAATAEGLAAMIRTGNAPELPEVRTYLGVGDDELIAGLIYVGYPREDEPERPLTRRTPVSELTDWRGW
jgi:nitroreductase